MSRPGLAVSLLVLVAVAAAVCVAFPATVFGGVEVVLRDGTKVRGDEIGSETDAKRLAVQVTGAGIRMTRFIPWRKVGLVNVDGQPRFAAEVKGTTRPAAATTHEARLQEFEDFVPRNDLGDEFSLPASGPLPDAFAGPPPCLGGPVLDAVVIGVRQDPLEGYCGPLRGLYPCGVPLSETAFALDLMRATTAARAFSGCQSFPAEEAPIPEPAAAVPGVAGRPLGLKGIAAVAHAVSSGGNVDWDALAVEVRGFDRADGYVPLRGTLTATLWGQRRELVPTFGERVVSEPAGLVKLGTWTVSLAGGGTGFEGPIGPASLGTAVVTTSAEAGVRLLLPFARPSPDHDLRLAPIGDVHVQLTVPGAGSFETVCRDVLLQQSSATRERLLVETRSRFLSHEKTSDSRLPVGPLFESQSTLRPARRVFTIQP